MLWYMYYIYIASVMVAEQNRGRGGSEHLSVHNEVAVLFPNDVVNLTHFSAINFNNRHVEVRFVKEQTLELRAILQMHESEYGGGTGAAAPAWSSSNPQPQSPC